MKDYAQQFNKPREPKPWNDVAREITENLIFVALVVFSVIIIAGVVI